MLVKSRLAIKRIPQSGLMNVREEVEAYHENTTNRYLETLDDDFIEYALNLGVINGAVLDAGTGPGRLAIKMAKKAPGLKITGIDLSEDLVLTAAQQAFNKGLQKQIVFQVGDVLNIPFDDNTFDMVICNSVLHHVDDPVKLLNEINRVAKREGAILIQDFKRPLKGLFNLYIAWFGRHYHGLFKNLYINIIRASYTKSELKQILDASAMDGASLYTGGIVHLGIERFANCTS